ncbi:hypothetical protein [Nonomuraea sp. NPDC049028]|uniref:hypothetical protein n=1 Tax=Nonomuraea sp. NPDC049028 TaxID=3364348 RepID=UPI0037225A7C
MRPLLAGRGYATPQRMRLHTLADVSAYAHSKGIKLRIDGSELQVRRPKPASRDADVQVEMDSGYRGLHNAHPDQVSVPPKRPGKDAPPEIIAAFEQARRQQSSERICVEHAIAESKKWAVLLRWTGERDDLEETIRAIGPLVSDRAAERHGG